jgi:diguanylate cyclase (GGDEF)-like protein/PAS domain S-box-containing protein
MSSELSESLSDLLLSARADQDLVQLYRLLELLPIAAYVCDADGLITYFNAQAGVLWGREPRLNHPDERWCGSVRIYDLAGRPLPLGDCCMARAIRLHEAFDQHRILVERPDGERRVVLVHANPLLDRLGRTSGGITLLVDITDDIKASESPLASADNERYRHIFEDSLNEIYIFDATSLRFVQTNAAALNNLGYSMDELRQKTPVDLKPLISSEAFEELISPLRAGTLSMQVFETTHQRKDGSLYDVEVHLQLMRTSTGSNFVAIVLDVTHRHQVERRLNYFNRIFSGSLNEIYIFDPETLRFLQVNPAARHNIGYTMDELCHMTPVDLKPQMTWDSFQNLLQPLRDGTQSLLVFETLHRRKNGSMYDTEVHLQLLKDGTASIFLAFILDISDRKRSDRLLSYQASHDSLTGLINRREFERHVAQVLDSSRETAAEHALCFMDLDQFKVVNDTCGHTAGDEMLRQLAAVIDKAIRRPDTLARLGGDEFGVFMEACSLEQAHATADGIRKAIENFQFSWESLSFKVGVSIGLVPITDMHSHLSELMKDADSACYLAKEAGRNRIHVYRADDEDELRRKSEMQWVNRLHQALDQDNFSLHAQAIVPTNPQRKTHYEFLLRMHDESGEIVSPGIFLPAAERYNLASSIDQWVLRSAFRVISENPRFASTVGHFAINLSGQSIQKPEMLNLIVELIDRTGIDGSKLCFEITETSAIVNLEVATIFIKTLKQHGCRFALDDFGSGFSSFAYLKQLPVDFLKIDGVFVKDIVDDPIDCAMVRSVNDIGRVMGLETIAEYVETDAVRSRLLEIGVDYLQGYGVALPRPISEILRDFDPALSQLQARRD